MPSVVEVLGVPVFPAAVLVGLPRPMIDTGLGVTELLGPLSVRTVELKDGIGQSFLSCEKRKPHVHVLE